MPKLRTPHVLSLLLAGALLLSFMLWRAYRAEFSRRNAAEVAAAVQVHMHANLSRTDLPLVLGGERPPAYLRHSVAYARAIQSSLGILQSLGAGGTDGHWNWIMSQMSYVMRDLDLIASQESLSVQDLARLEEIRHLMDQLYLAIPVPDSYGSHTVFRWDAEAIGSAARAAGYPEQAR